MNTTEESLRLCRAELARVQSALEAALETQAEDRRRRDDAERRLVLLSESVVRQLVPRPRPGLATRLRSRSTEATQLEIVQSSSLFDGAWYISHYPHVVDTGLPPAEHYLRLGADEGLDPGPDFSTADYLRGHPETAKSRENPLVHHLRAP